MNKHKQFILDSERVAFDLNHRSTIKFNISKYKLAQQNGHLNFKDRQNAYAKTAYLKREALENWSKYLMDFESNFSGKGGIVHWAEDVTDAHNILKQIFKDEKATYVMKSKSMTTEEIHLNEMLEDMNLSPIETDLGEYIVQLAGEKPYHILTPAMHKSKKDVAQLFHEKFGLPINSTPEEITKFVREDLRAKFFDLTVGITGANFLLADSGSAALTENEGNGIMTKAFCKTHIIIAGIEKIVPSIKDLAMFWPVLSNAGTGQKLTVYNSIFTPDKQSQQKTHILLLDNGRSHLYQQTPQWKALACIRCGACLNYCPIYNAIGGYTYNSVYTGPIGSVITQHLKQDRDFKHQSFACSLCGKCKEVCPVKIDLPELLLYNRKDVPKDWKENTSMQIAKYVLMKRRRLDLNILNVKSKGISLAKEVVFGNKKQLNNMAVESFSMLYKSRND